MKGIILAGGAGKRLAPVTRAISKQVIPLYDKPMIYYPLATLMSANIKDIMIISTPRDLPSIKMLLGDGSDFGVKIQYAQQDSPDGIAQAFIIAEEFIGSDPVCLILGDNLYYGNGLEYHLQKASKLTKGAYIFGYHVSDPERYGVIEFDEEHNVKSIVEKPKQPKSNWAVSGLYFYDADVVEIAKNIKPSPRGELEITDVNNAYLERGDIKVKFLDRGIAWLDTGTPNSLLQAANFIQVIEARQGLKVGCIEEIAYQKGFISKEQFLKLIDGYCGNDYAKYLERVLIDSEQTKPEAA